MRKLTLVFTQFWLLQCNGVGRGAGGQHFLKHSTSYYMSKKEVLTQFNQSYERDDVDIYRILYSTPIKQLCSVPKFTANLYCIYLIVNLKYILKQMQYRFAVYFVGLHRILNWPDIRPPDIRPIEYLYVEFQIQSTKPAYIYSHFFTRIFYIFSCNFICPLFLI